MYEIPNKQEEINKHVANCINDIVLAIAQIGQALSVHLAIADIDETVERLASIQSQLSILDSLIGEGR